MYERKTTKIGMIAGDDIVISNAVNLPTQNSETILVLSLDQLVRRLTVPQPSFIRFQAI